MHTLALGLELAIPLPKTDSNPDQSTTFEAVAMNRQRKFHNAVAKPGREEAWGTRREPTMQLIRPRERESCAARRGRGPPRE